MKSFPNVNPPKTRKKRPLLELFLLGSALILVSASIGSFWGGDILRQKEESLRDYESLIYEQTANGWSHAANRLLDHLADHAGLNSAMAQNSVDVTVIALQVNSALRLQEAEGVVFVSVVSLSQQFLYTDTRTTLADFDSFISGHGLRTDNSLLIYPDEASGRDELIWLRPMSGSNSYREALVALHFPIAGLEAHLLNKSGLSDKGLRLAEPAALGEAVTTLQEPGEQGANRTLRPTVVPAGATVVPLADTRMFMVWQDAAGTGGTPNRLLIMLAIALPCVALLAAAARMAHLRLQKPMNRLLQQFDIELEPHEQPYGALDRYIRQQHHEINDLQEQFNGFIPDLKLSTFQHLLWGELTEAELVEKVERLKLPLHGELFYIAVATIDEYGQFLNRYSNNDQLTIHHILRKQAMELFAGSLNSVTFTPRHGIIAILIGASRGSGESDRIVREASDKYREWTRDHYEFSISVAISRPRRGYASMSGSYHEATMLLNYKMTLGNDMTITFGDVRTAAESKPNHNLLQQCKHIARLVIQGQSEQALAEVDQMLEHIAGHPYKAETAIGIFAHLLGELEYMLFELQINIHDIFEEHIYDVLYAKSTLSHVRLWLGETVFEAIRHYLGRQHVSRQKQIAQQVVHQIHDHYDEDLTFQQVADELGVSVSQLSRLFKAETGKTFSESLIQYRMQKSAELLENTDMSIKDIADKMRYTNVQNFSRIFKQVLGMPPGEYRKQSNES